MLINENFLLQSKTAEELFFKYAKNLPIYDYHCHLDPREIYENKEFSDIGEMWLKGDHYKWRLMRQNNVNERYITGDASYFEKFEKFVECIEVAIGNPLYHWCHMELKRYFDCDLILKKENTKAIWEQCLKFKYTPQKLIEMSNVAMIGTTDAPDSDLKYHKLISESGKLDTKVLPSFRPNLKDADIDYLFERIEYFHQNGCRLSDHGLDEFDENSLCTLKILAEEYGRRGWVMQLHIGALRNNNISEFKRLGGDIGYDSMNDQNIAEYINKLFGQVENLPKTVLYSLNPTHNALLATITGNFRNVQHGSAWWFNDHFDGMREQMKSLASLGALNKFIGMLTDSRSFLSYTRHEYFRRILCDLIGEWVEAGHFPNDESLLKPIIEGICYYNAKEFFEGGKR